MKSFQKINYKLPAYMLIIINLLGFCLLFISNGYQPSILYIGLGVLGSFLVMYTVLVLCRMGDKFIMLIVSMLVTIGVLLLCRIDIDYGIKQIVWVGLGIVVFFASYCIYYNIWFWDKLWFLYLGFGTVLFVLTLLLAKTVSGSRNWISLFGIMFQPSEVTKILYIMFLSCYYSGAWTKPIFRITPQYVTALGTYLFIGFLVLQRDWGTILVLFSIYIFMTYVYGKDKKFLALNVILAVVTGFLGYHFLYHIQVRVSTWLDPWADISNKGYQITQSLFAIASGGFFGRGLGNGSPSLIPEVHTDFIFAAVCEEMGVFGGAAVILLFFLLVYRFFKISLTASNAFDKSVSLGITLMFALQTFIIIGGVTKLIPLTGITLPFVSYGGTSLIVSFASMGIMQAISARTERGTEHDRE